MFFLRRAYTRHSTKKVRLQSAHICVIDCQGVKKSVPFTFGGECVQAFEKLKKDLTSYPTLALYDPSADTELHTDASAVGLAAILLQKQKPGAWAPVAYYSQSTNKSEAKYHSFELEMLAIVKSIERFHLYLYGINFAVITDCNAVVYAINKANLNPRIARWTLRLQNYKFTLIHRAGKRMAHVDALSRHVAYLDALPLERELEFGQLRDSKLKTIAEKLEFENDDKFELIDGLVYRRGEDRPRFVIPDEMVNNILRTYHDDMAHCGYDKTIQGICTNYWFPAIHKRVKDYVTNCITYLVANASTHTKEGEMQTNEEITSPFHTLYVDHFGPLTETKKGYKYILVIVDAFTRFSWLYATKSTSSKEVIEHLKPLFSIFGNPRRIITDRGTAFTSHEFSDFVKQIRIKHSQVAVAAPWANGKVERVN